MAQDRSEAGRKGGEKVSEDKEHMSEIGKKGGEASRGGRQGEQSQGGSGQRGGSSEQHRQAGQQSHKNS